MKPVMRTLRRDTPDMCRVEDWVGEETTFSITSLHPGKSTRGHNHRYKELYYIFSGEGKLYFGHEEHYLIMPVVAGVSFELESYEYHRMENTGSVMLIFGCIWRTNS